jgi:DTW domain-containing protein
MNRAMCATCLRAQSTCICQWTTPTPHATEVLILQHPMEVHNAKGSARLLHLSLPHSRMEIGEVFEEAALLAWLTGPWPPHTSKHHGDGERLPKQAILLYPDSPVGDAPGLVKPPVLSPSTRRDPSPLRLVVLDGTWRKSRKMLYLNPQLQQLPRLALQGTPPSRYRIRAAHKADQLSTLEATCAALAQMEGDVAPFLPLLAAFDGFVAQQMAYVPR